MKSIIMRKEKPINTKSEKHDRLKDQKQEKSAKPVRPSSPNMGYHGKDKEKDLNPEE